MKILRITLAVFISFCLIFTFSFGLKKISKESKVAETEDYNCILTLWHVDTFEGGIGSRKQFLLRVAREFEKQHQGTLVMITEYTPNAVKEAVKNGQSPDIISFGIGVEIPPPIKLSIQTNFSGGKVGENLYATPWAIGGYCLIKKSGVGIDLTQNHFENLIVSRQEFNQPLVAFALQNLSASKIQTFSPLDAYVNFLNEKESVLLGTQRDIHRLQNRGVEVEALPLNQFNDLIQYVSITNAKNFNYCTAFVNTLLSKKMQSSLDTIGIFSPNFTINYDNVHLNLMEEIKPTCTISAFADDNTLSELFRDSLSVALGDKSCLNKIKKLLV